MFWKKSSKPATIGSLKQSGQRLAFFCDACKTVTYQRAEETHLLDTVQVDVLQEFYPCPECGHSNGESGNKLRITVEAH
jgi:hypothetical protein